MCKHLPIVGLVVMISFAAGCAETDSSDQAEGSSGNVLLAEWTGPYGGVPAFDQMDLGDLKPALEEGMAMHLEEIEAIASNPEPPTFENTIAAMEGAGRELKRARNYWRL